MEKILFLDDRQARWDFFVKLYPNAFWAKTANGAIDYIFNNYNSINYIFLDHDLGENEPTGMEVVRFLVKNRYQFYDLLPIIIVHTWNPPAGDRMTDDLKRAGYKVIRLPFSFNVTNNN